MFSGIIQAVVPIHNIQKEINCKTYFIMLPNHLMSNLKIGCSISNNGCCTTVIAISHNLIIVNLMHETLKLTNMNMLKIGDLINVERALNYHDEIGGHLMTGHIDGIGKIKKIICYKNNKKIWIELKNKKLQKYLITQGSIGIDGVSLTINKVLNNYIRVCLTSYTENHTTLGIKKIGDIVNIEIDFFIKTIIKKMEKNILPKFIP